MNGSLELAEASPQRAVLTAAPELSHGTLRRLPWLGLAFSAAYILWRLGQEFAGVSTGATATGRVLQHAFDAALVMPGIAMFVLARSTQRVVDRLGARLQQAREIGSYEMLDRLGEGGMGQVWRARHRLLARPAAIKLIRPELLGANADPARDTLRRFEREARETAKLGSVHTINVYDCGVTEDGQFYYVMELLNGISLERYVQQFGPMPPDRVVYLLRQVCHSLGEAHDHGLIHRDIKPANIFMCRQGPDDDFVKVLDFGLVKRFGDQSEGTMPTVEDLTAGTPAYMAPEIALNDAQIDGRADIYALGCVAYYLLTGEPVFSGSSSMAVIVSHLHDTPRPPSQRAKFDVPPLLDALVLQCLEKDKNSRPRNAEAVARRLSQSMPTHTWTGDAARRWWDTRQQGGADDRDPRHDSSRLLTQPQRCWPCLNSEPRALHSA